MSAKIIIKLEDRQKIEFELKNKICFIGENGIGKNLCCRMLYQVFKYKTPTTNLDGLVEEFTLIHENKTLDLTKEVDSELIDFLVEELTEEKGKGLHEFHEEIYHLYSEQFRIEAGKLKDKTTNLDYAEFSNMGHSVDSLLKSYEQKVNYIQYLGDSIHIIARQKLFDSWLINNRMITFYSTHNPECIGDLNFGTSDEEKFKKFIVNSTFELVNIKWN